MNKGQSTKPLIDLGTTNKRTADFILLIYKRLIYEQEYKSTITLIDYKNKTSAWMDRNKKVFFSIGQQGQYTTLINVSTDSPSAATVK